MKKWACNWTGLLLTRFNGYLIKIWCSPSVVPYRGIYSDSYKQQVWEQAKGESAKAVPDTVAPIRDCFSVYSIPHFLGKIFPTISNLTPSEYRAKTTVCDRRRIHPSVHSLCVGHTCTCCSLQLTPDPESPPPSLPASVRKKSRGVRWRTPLSSSAEYTQALDAARCACCSADRLLSWSYRGAFAPALQCSPV